MVNMENPVNKNTLLWFAKEVEQYESVSGHSRIVVEMMNGVCTHFESTEKGLCKNITS
jgi:hypothetical protein